MTGTVAVPGIAIAFPGRGALVVPPLPLGVVEQMHTRLSGWKAGIDAESVKTIIDATLASLQQNYPDLTRDDVGRMVNVGNMIEVFEALMDVSGLKRKAKEKAAGEAPSQAPPSPGSTSTPT